jgi:splicing suppressor protein 51
MSDTCASCKKTAATAQVAAFKQCAKCKTTSYCSRDCQKADWKSHKKTCSTNAASRAEHSSSYSSARLNDLESHVPNPFTRLDQGKYLHDRPEKDVYKLLIDSFRMRQADDWNFENKTTPRSVYSGASSSIQPFREYLAKATRKNLLPPWWSAEKQKECEAFGESGAWQDLRRKVLKQEVIEHYGDEKMPMQVRMLAEAVYGAGSMGQDGSGMREMMVQMESGGLDGKKTTMLNISMT